MEHVLAQLERERECVAPDAVLGAEANDAKAVEDVEAEKTLRTPRSSSPSHTSHSPSHTSHSPSHSSHRGLWSDALTAPSVASTPSSPHGTSVALTASTSSPQLTQLGKLFDFNYIFVCFKL